MNIAVCEDTKTQRDELCSHIEKYFRERSCPVEINAYEAGGEFLKTFAPGKYQMVFLDIYMPGFSGIETAKKIREADNECVIIFTTSSKEHALESYRVQALQYLEKPVNYGDLKMALNKCHALFADSMRHIEVLSNRIAVKILLRDILFIEVYANACTLHTRQRTVKTYSTLEEINKKLAGEPFLRSHRTHIVNMNHIAEILDNDFLLKDGSRVPIRKAEKVAIKQAYMDYLFCVTRREP